MSVICNNTSNKIFGLLKERKEKLQESISKQTQSNVEAVTSLEQMKTWLKITSSSNNQIKLLRDVLRTREPILTKETITQLLDFYNIQYSISQLTSGTLEILKTIKRWQYYINCLNPTFVSPLTRIALFMGDSLYVVWGMILANSYGLTEQVGSYYTVYNTNYTGFKTIAGIKIQFKKVRESFFYGRDLVSTKEKYSCYVMSKERMIIQMVNDSMGIYPQREELDMQKVEALLQSAWKKTLLVKTREYPLFGCKSVK